MAQPPLEVILEDRTVAAKVTVGCVESRFVRRLTTVVDGQRLGRAGVRRAQTRQSFVMQQSRAPQPSSAAASICTEDMSGNEAVQKEE